MKIQWRSDVVSDNNNCLLLSLLLPSCIVASIKDLGNITSNILTICESTLNMTANNNKNIGVDLFDQLFQGAYDNFDEVQGCSLAQSAYSPRTHSISSSECEESYTECLEKLNDKIDKDKPVVTHNSEPSNGSQLGLEYMTSKISQIRYLLVVILELNSVSEVQYKDMMIDRWWKVSIGIINVVKSEV